MAVDDDIELLLANLARWSGEERGADAAAARARERWLRQQAVEDARFAGVALDLAERGTGVVVGTTTGRAVRGRLAAVAGDFVVVRLDGGGAVLLGFDAVVSIRPEPGSRGVDAAADRSAPLTTTLAEVLAGLAGDRPRARVVLPGGEALVGEVRAVGADVVTLRLDGSPPATVYLRLAAVRDVTLLA